jgi:glycosyltransferase involved in cell wall biosynthesis
MKIVITAPSLDEHKNVSGISTIVRQIIEHSSHEYAHFKAGREDGEPAGIKWLIKQALLPVKFFTFVKRERPDVVHINTALTDLSIWRDAALSRAAKLAGRRVVLSVHGGKYLVNEFESPRVAAATENILRTAKIVVVYSELEKAEVERRWKGLDIRVLPNAVPHRADAPPERNNPLPIIIFFGRLHESKGLAEIVKACEKLRSDGFDFRFNCFGDGPEKDTFLPRMEEILGDRFHYGGVLTSGEKYRELDKADIFLLPSIYGEGLPMAILEAMAAGCVIVASEMASVAAVVRDGVNGCLIEPGNKEQLVSRLKLLLGNRPDWRPLQQAAMRTVRERFAISGYIEDLEDIYRSATA